MNVEGDGPPLWFLSPVKWSEDTTVHPSRWEDIDKVWHRLYGTYFADEVEVAVYEGGGCRATLYESGRISILGDGGDVQIRELPPGSEKPRRSSPAAALLADAGYKDTVGRSPKTEPRIPFTHFQVVVVDDGMGDSKNLLFVLDDDGEVWTKEINKNGVAVSSTAVWAQSK